MKTARKTQKTCVIVGVLNIALNGCEKKLKINFIFHFPIDKLTKIWYNKFEKLNRRQNMDTVKYHRVLNRLDKYFEPFTDKEDVEMARLARMAVSRMLPRPVFLVPETTKMLCPNCYSFLGYIESVNKDVFRCSKCGQKITVGDPSNDNL